MPKLRDEDINLNNTVVSLKHSAARLTASSAKVDEVLKNAAPKQPFKSHKRLAKERKIERTKTKGEMWFHMPRQKLTENVKKDLEILRMRGALDTKHFYKKNDREVLPKYFQVGHVVDSPVDYYSSRVPKKERRKTMVEELLADAEFQQKSKKKYRAIVTEKIKTSHYKQRKI